MKKLALFMVFSAFFLFGQKKYTYNFSNTNDFGHKFNFKTELFVDGTTKLFLGYFGADKTDFPDLIRRIEKPGIYLIYRKNSNNPAYIEDQWINEPYFFKDDYKIVWSLSDEKKTIDGIILNKATTSFRGRNYIAWYDPNNKVNIGPWKFDGLPGLIYTIADDLGRRQWSLLSEQSSDGKFVQSYDITKKIYRQYKEYPLIRYAIPPAIQRDMDKDPNFKFKVTRTDLETEFEWEKK